MQSDRPEPPGGAETGPARLPAWLSALGERVYARGLAARSAKFDAGLGVVTIDRPVVSVGNLTVGGTGKTPMVAWLLETLLAEGHDPAVAMRGYRSRNGLSDEAELYRQRFNEVPVVAQPQRLEGLIDLFATERGQRVDCVVLDDGFQHRRIARQMDIVLIDASRPLQHDRLLPAGWLREPVESLRRATHVVVTHAEAVREADLQRLEQWLSDEMGRGIDAVARHAWTRLEITEPSGEQRTEPVSWLRGRQVVAACAIGNPGPFLASVSRATGTEVAGRTYRDHHVFDRADVRTLQTSVTQRGAQALVVTAKDWTKLGAIPASTWPCPIVRPVLQMQFDRGEAALRADLEEVLAAHANSVEAEELAEGTTLSREHQ